MFMLSPIVMSVMMVDVRDLSGLRQVGSNILLVLEGMLDMDSDQRHDASRLGQKQQPQEHRSKTP